ncbi:MAG: hypothetical protein HYU64_10405 [Armatimonadetes bacterium]|nr:hypothetical protein [Armatimonadota bacterium]
MEIRLLDFLSAEKEYADFGRRQFRPLAQHSLAWQKMLVLSCDMKWNALFLHEGTEMVGCLPFCEREGEMGKVWASMPFSAGYGGVLRIENCDRDLVYERLLKAFVTYARENGVDILSISSSPFRDDGHLYRRYFEPDHCVEKFFQYLPGRAYPECLPPLNAKKYAKRIKECRRIAERYKYGIQHLRTGADPKLNNWYNEALCERYKDLKAPSPPAILCTGIVEHLAKEGLAEFSYIEQKGRVLAGGIFLYGWCQDVFLRASHTGDLNLRASYVLDSQVIERGAALNVHAHNFQSSPTKRSTTYTYKKNWGCLEGSTFYLVKVLAGLERFLNAGKDAVTAAFPYFFVLPHSLYSEG